MGTWIAHLRLAENMLARIPNLDEAQFAIGNIAPDSGIPDEKWQHFDPPKEVTHFMGSDPAHDDARDLDFYRRYLATLSPQDAGRFSFRLGYFMHLVTDNLWSDLIGELTEKRFAAEFEQDPEFIWKVKGDWYGLDFIDVRDHPQSLFWRVFLAAQPVAMDLDFLPAQALQQQLTYIKTFYQRQDEEIQAMYKRPYIYLSQSEMDGFVTQATAKLQAAYQLLWPNPPDLAGKYSVLELM